MPEIPPTIPFQSPGGDPGQQDQFPLQRQGILTTTPDLAKVAERANANIIRMLFFRTQYDQRRSFFYRQYVGQQDRKTFPDNVTPRSNTFVPYPLSNVETIVSRTLDAFFSFDPWFECKGRSAMDETAADAMAPTLAYKLHRAAAIGTIEELIRNIAIYGFAGIKVDWDWGYDVGVDAQPEFQMEPMTDAFGNRLIDPTTGQPAMKPVLDPATGAPIVIARVGAGRRGRRTRTSSMPR